MGFVSLRHMGSSQPRRQTHIYIAGGFFTTEPSEIPSELFLILKINFICKYNTGWKLQKTFLKKGNIANMQKGMKGVREGRKEGKKQE